MFQEFIQKLFPRILGFLDRDNSSSTAGCFDRNYWHYKLSDISNSRLQEAVYILKHLYKNKIDNKLYNNKILLQWINNSIMYWFKIQNNDGSFNEVYPYERSFCATSFSTMIITDTLLNLKQIPFDEQNLLKTGAWLNNNINKKISNQIAAAASALYNIYLLTNNDYFFDAYKKKITFLIKNYNSLKYFPEYGGFDLGYETITLSILTKVYEKSNNPDLKNIILQAITKIDNYLNDNGEYDFTKMSRQTQFIYPYSFYFFNKDIFNKIMNGINKNLIISPFWLDDRYCIGLLIDYIKCMENNKNENVSG